MYWVRNDPTLLDNGWKYTLVVQELTKLQFLAEIRLMFELIGLFTWFNTKV